MPRRRSNFRKAGGKNFNKEVKKIVKKELVKAAEPKDHYTSAGPSNVDFDGSMWTLSDPAQGDTVQTRDGDRIRATHVDIRGLVAAASGGSYSTMRLIMFKWKEDTAENVPLPNDILQNTYLGASSAPFAPLTVGEEARKYTVLMDRTFQPNNDGGYSRFFHVNKKLNIPMYFNDTATTGSNQVHLLAISSDGITAYPQIQFVCDFRYVDL